MSLPQTAPQLEAQRLYLDEVKQEGEGLTGQERADHDSLVGELKVDLAAADAYQAAAALAIEAARSYLDSDTARSPESTPSAYQVGPDKVGWVSQDAAVELTQHTSPSGHPFQIGRMTELSARTSVDRKMIRPDTYDRIEDIVTTHVAAKLDAPDSRYRALRPLKNEPTAQDTTLNAYKDDQVNPPGFGDNALRVLVLEDPAGAGGGEAETPVYLIASVCKHDDQQRLIYGL